MFSSNFQILLYLTKIVYRKYNPHWFIIYMIIKYYSVLKQKHILTLQAISPGLLLDLLKESEIDDVNNTIIISKGTQASLKVVETITISGSNIKRKVFIATNKDLHAEGIGLISYNLQSNLKGAEKCRFKNCKERIEKFADEVELCLVSTSNDWSHLMIDRCLKNYFKTPKLLYKDDIIEVDLRQYGKDVFFELKKYINIYDKMHFKCNKLIYNGLEASSEGIFCVSDKSTLKQTANIQCFIPKKIHGVNYMCELLLPDALNNYFKDIKKAVYFFVNKSEKSNFSPVFLLEGRRGSGKHLLVQCIACHFGMHLYSINNFDISANVYAQNETKLRNVLFCAKMAAPCILEINNFENFGKNNEGQYDERLINHFIVELKTFFRNDSFPTFIFCNSNEKNIPLELKRLFLKIFEITCPNELERENMLHWILQQNEITTDINLNNITNKTHGFLLEDLRTLLHYASINFYKENQDVTQKNIPEEYFLKAVDVMQSSYNESLGAPKVPKVKWTDIGGLNEVKEEIIKTIKLPLRYPELLKKTGLKRSGILLFGPPGTGKTLLAKAVATECGLCFLSVKGPELLNMYVGQSEQNVREVFERGRGASPCIIFFDELDSLAPNRGVAGDSGGVMDRVVSQLLAEMDGLNRTGDIFVIGATNRPDLIDPALLRPGRFDKLLYVGPCTDKKSKIAVLTALTKCFRFSDKSVIDEVVDLCPENISGADFYGLCSNAWMSAVRRLITAIGHESAKNATLDDVIVILDDFQSAIKNIKPSIKQADMEYFNKLKSEFI